MAAVRIFMTGRYEPETCHSQMVRRSKLLLALVVVLASAAIGLAYGGVVESVVSPEQLPGPQAVGIVAIFGVIVLGVVASSILDRRAWKSLGSNAGLTAGGGPEFEGGRPAESDKPTLTGVVRGRPVRMWAYSTGGGRHSSNRTYTVVEAELGTPVDWHAAFDAGGTDDAPEDPAIDAAKTQTIDGLGVRGDAPQEVVRGILTRAVRDAVTAADGEVAVGDVKDNVVGDVLDELDDADGMAATFAEGMLDVATDGTDGPSRVVQHRARGLLTDGATLQSRIDAVTTLADEVDRTSTATR